MTRPLLQLTPTLRGFAAAALLLGLVHASVYYVVTRLTLLRPDTAFIDARTFLDAAIPHVPAMWPLYWLPYILIPAAGIAALVRLNRQNQRSLVAAWGVMILIGGAIQLGWPAEAPWPDEPARTQLLFHESSLILPYATLPSMHVAHTTLAAAAAAVAMPSVLVRTAAVVAVLLVSAATLLLKEHLFLDAVAGVALATASFVLWRWLARPTLTRR